MSRRKKRGEGVSLGEGSPGSNVVASQPSEAGGKVSEEVKIPGALEKIAKVLGIDVNSIVQQYMPQLIQFIDSRIEAKLKEYMPKFANEVRNVILDMLKSPPSPQPQPSQNPGSQGSNLGQVTAPMVQVGDSTVRDMILTGLMRAVFGGGSTIDELKKYAEIRAIAEAIVGRGPTISDVVKAFVMGQNYTLRMLYLMTRGKWEKVEESLFGSVEKLFGEEGEKK